MLAFGRKVELEVGGGVGGLRIRSVLIFVNVDYRRPGEDSLDPEAYSRFNPQSPTQ